MSASKMHETELIVCDDDNPPDEYTAGSSTRILCTLTTNLHPVPEYLWKVKMNSNSMGYKRLDFDVGMQIESGGLRFDCRVDGVVYGKVTAAFE